MGKSLRSFVFIEDLNDAYYKILIKGKPGSSYHISSNKIYSIKNIVLKASSKIVNSKKYLIFIKKDRMGKDFKYFLNSNKLRNELKWKPKINISKGIIETKKWIDINYGQLSKISTKYKHIK